MTDSFTDEQAMEVWKAAEKAAGPHIWSRQSGVWSAKNDPQAAAAIIRDTVQAEVAKARPDTIDLYRTIRGAGRKDADKARAVAALLGIEEPTNATE